MDVVSVNEVMSRDKEVNEKRTVQVKQRFLFPTSDHPSPSESSSCETTDPVSALTLTPVLPETDPTLPCVGALFVVGLVEPAFEVQLEFDISLKN